MAIVSVDTLVKEIHKRIKNHHDACVIITGPERLGKSTAAYWLARRLDDGFNHERMILDGREFPDVANGLKPGDVAVLDEAIRGGFSRDAMGKENKELVKFLVVCGALNLVSFILFPNIKWLDSYIKDHRAHYWILIEQRGRALVHQRIRADYPGAKPRWRQLFRFKFPQNEGPDWDAYEANKEALIRGGNDGDGEYVPAPSEIRRVAHVFRRLLAQKAN